MLRAVLTTLEREKKGNGFNRFLLPNPAHTPPLDQQVETV